MQETGIARRPAMPLAGKHFELGVEMRPHLPTAPKNMAHVVVQGFERRADNQDDMQRTVRRLADQAKDFGFAAAVIDAAAHGSL